MSNAVVAIKQFNQSLTSPEMTGHLSKLLPPNVSVDRFTRTTMVAIQNNPSVLEADRQSLYNAISRAAQDGLMPDGREAALIIHNVKTNGGFAKMIRYSQMVEGVIKQLGKAGILVYASSVYEADEIEIWGDENGQYVRHRPKVFGNRGDFIGVYATAKVGDRTFVEAMNMEEIERVRSASRSGENGPWKTWYDRMAQKSVLHRLKKRLPILDSAVSESLRALDEEVEEAAVLSPEPEIVSEPEITQDEPPAKVKETKRPRGLQAVVDTPIDGEDLF
jgi:recombination protein RecT